jgi:CRP/FNR family cyclic AMP-dependent transcriptional regulator
MRSTREGTDMEQRAVIESLSASAFFGLLPEAERAALADRMRRVRFEPEQMVFSRGDPARDVYLVLEGRVRLSILSSDGRELSFDYAGPGDIFGEIAVLDGGNRTAGATAISQVEALLLPQKILQALIESNPKVATAVIRFLCQRLRETNQTLEAIALHRIEVRLARLILSALRQQSPVATGGKVPVDLDMTQSELALLVGASRPKVSLALTALEEIGAIARNGTAWLCSIAALEDIADME